MTNRIEEIFTSTDCVRAMYFLARENPQITITTVAKELDIEEENADLILNNLTYFRLAIKEAKKGYTLTNEGLAMLFNFHKNFVVNG
ncbi:hypothetical protein KKG83_06180 [Candidatus Micrarchaeota archaeon]|nr:hypothetical protein [Candidatus Micrarchaeota archaeon]MBU2477031.1 hypothetical protein [Candidatus Micrarchaeota archaeon]